MNRTNAFSSYVRDDERNVIITLSACLLQKNADWLKDSKLPMMVRFNVVYNDANVYQHAFNTEFITWESLRNEIEEKIEELTRLYPHDILHNEYVQDITGIMFDDNKVKFWYDVLEAEPEKYAIH